MEYYPKMDTARTEPRTILVTGGAGFIGSNFIRHARASCPDSRIVCLDSLTYAGSERNIADIPRDGRFVFIQGDVTDVNVVTRICDEYEPSHTIHFAAESHVDRSIDGGAIRFAHTNISGTVTLLQALQGKQYLRKYLQVSTDEVYGSLSLEEGAPFKEDSPLLPNSPYAASKAGADLMVRSFYETYGMPTVITRCSNNYGPYQFPEKLIPLSIKRVLSGEMIALYGDGRNVRDWIHVEDHANALLLALLQGLPGETYNVGASDELDNIAMAECILSSLNRHKDEISFIKDRKGHDLRYAVDSRKISQQLGWRPKHRVSESLPQVVNWYVENQGWMDAVLLEAETQNTVR